MSETEARRTSQFHKDNHLAAEAELEECRKAVVSYAGHHPGLSLAENVLEMVKDLAHERAEVARLEIENAGLRGILARCESYMSAVVEMLTADMTGDQEHGMARFNSGAWVEAVTEARSRLARAALAPEVKP